MWETNKGQRSQSHPRKITACGEWKVWFKPMVAVIWGRQQRNWTFPMELYRISCARNWGTKRRLLSGYLMEIKPRMMLWLEYVLRYYAESLPYMHSNVTGHETWMHLETSETKKISISWRHSSTPPIRNSKSSHLWRKVWQQYFFWDHQDVFGLFFRVCLFDSWSDRECN